jgi:Fe-S cluster assembly protein SufD
MSAITLPTRRDEAWRWSDLRAAYGDTQPPLLPPALAHAPTIVQLAGAARAYHGVEMAPGDVGLRVERLAETGEDVSALELIIPAGAAMTRIVFQDADGVSLNHLRVRMAEGSVFRQFVLTTGAKLGRLETHVEIDGAGAQVGLYGVYLAAASRHADVTSVVTHARGEGRTRQLVKGAVRAGGRGVFQGKIVVAQNAQRTDAEQHHDALLLEEGAEVFAKPELEIHADDVSCAHGNTVGALDDQALFYLRQRGVPKSEATALLVDAFLREAVPDWLPEGISEEVDQKIAAWLEASS